MAALDGLTGTSQFGAVNFWIVGGDATLPVVGGEARAEKTPIPHGNRRTVQLGGWDDEDLQVEVLVKDADLASLLALAQANTAATLARPNEDDRTATLVRVAGIRQWAPGVGASRAQLTFVL